MTINNENGYINYSVDDMHEDEFVIDKVEAFVKRKGTGSALVNEVIKIAEEEGKALTLCAYPQDDSIELEDLVEFYKNLGFEIEYDEGSCVLMRYFF